MFWKKVSNSNPQHSSHIFTIQMILMKFMLIFHVMLHNEHNEIVRRKKINIHKNIVVFYHT
jgi:hypothetical protein